MLLHTLMMQILYHLRELTTLFLLRIFMLINLRYKLCSRMEKLDVKGHGVVEIKNIKLIANL